MYGPLIIAYLFLGGTAAGGFFMMAAWDLAFLRISGEQAADGAHPHNLRTIRAFESFQAQMHTACLLFLALSMLFLICDLGVPERALLILLRPHATVLTFGAVTLLVELAVGGLLTLGSVFRIRALRGRTRRILNVICCLTSLSTMAYTGVFLMSNTGIAFWSSAAIVPLFISSSLSCGTALMLLAGYFANKDLLSFQATRLFQKWHLAFLAVEAVSLVLFLAAAFTNPAAANACEVLLSPRLLPTAAIGVLGFSLVIPAACEGFALSRREGAALPVADAFCLCGGLLLRFCIISCGIH